MSWNDDELYIAYLLGCEDDCIPEPMTKPSLLGKMALPVPPQKDYDRERESQMAPVSANIEAKIVEASDSPAPALTNIRQAAGEMLLSHGYIMQSPDVPIGRVQDLLEEFGKLLIHGGKS